MIWMLLYVFKFESFDTLCLHFFFYLCFDFLLYNIYDYDHYRKTYHTFVCPKFIQPFLSVCFFFGASKRIESPCVHDDDQQTTTWIKTKKKEFEWFDSTPNHSLMHFCVCVCEYVLYVIIIIIVYRLYYLICFDDDDPHFIPTIVFCWFGHWVFFYYYLFNT